MPDALVSEFAQVCAHSFAGLGDAVRSMLDLLERQLPSGRVVFAELNYNTDEYRVLDARGEGVDALCAGARIPLRESFCAHMATGEGAALVGKASKDKVYSKLPLRKTAGIESYVAAPVELSDGTRVASVCAMSSTRDSYDSGHREILTVAARLLAYEWEHVIREGKLRRLLAQQRALTGDPLTGLPLRDAFLEQLDRELHLTQRGITESYLLALKPIGIEQARATSGDAVANLILQTTGEVIMADARRSDIAARVADDIFAVILVGCRGMEGAEAFLARVQSAFARKLGLRPEKLELAWGLEQLSDAESAADALARVEAALGAEPLVTGAKR